MPSLQYYAFNYGLSAKVTSFNLNHIMEAKVTQSFDLSKLTNRTHAMLLNQFKRGYKLRATSGQLTTLTRMLVYKFNLLPFPVINHTCTSGQFFIADPDFVSWLQTTGLLMNFFVELPDTSYMPRLYEFPVVHYFQPKGVFDSPSEFNKLLLEYLKDNPGIFNPRESLYQVIEFIENKEIIIFDGEFV